MGKAVAFSSGAPDADSVAIADVNGDGIPDVVIANYCQTIGLNGCIGSGEVAVLLGRGNGTFQPAVTYGTGGYLAYSVAVGDLNGDGVPDLAVANLCLNLDQYGDCTGIGGVGVLLGNGDGTFQSAVAYSTGADWALSITIGDLNGDGKPDLVVANAYGPYGSDGSAAVLLGNGDGTFQPAVNYDSGGYNADSIAIADVNGNGVPDLVVANLCQNEGCYTDGEVAVLLGNGDGTFQPAMTYDSGERVAYSLGVGDLTGNGILDVVVSNRISNGSTAHNAVSVLVGNGDGTLQPAGTYVLGGWQYDAVAVGDINGDGIPDLAVVEECQRVRGTACLGTGLVSVLLGNGDGTFQAPAKYGSGGNEGSGIAIRDVNGDGRPDIVVTNACADDSCQGGSVSILLNETSYSSKTELTASPNPAQVNQSVTFTATIASTPSVPNGEAVTFYNGNTKLGAGTTTNGTATLTASFAKAKTYTIKADYSGDAFRKKSSGNVKLVVNP
jgi:Big-like domain-containing protein/VCBS repeat protein